MTKKADELISHESDGILEYDNDLPKWWVWLFWLTIFYGIGYTVWFHAPSTPTPEARLARSLSELDTLKAATDARREATVSVTLSEEGLLKVASDGARVEAGRAIYAARCAACHGGDGGGVIGPNLTDNAWIHGGSLMDIWKVVSEGVVTKGMLAWKSVLTEGEITSVVVFVRSLQGTTPQAPKPAEGEPYSG